MFYRNRSRLLPQSQISLSYDLQLMEGKEMFRKSFSKFVLVPTLAFGSLLTTQIGPAHAGSIDLLGAKLSWSDSMYVADGCSQYAFDYVNGSGIRLLSFSMTITDPFGRKLEDASIVGMDSGRSGTFSEQICTRSFTNGRGPYTVTLRIEDFAGSSRQSSAELYFLEIPRTPSASGTPTTLPSPIPTVTVTATPRPAPTVTVTAAPIVTQDPFYKNEAFRLQAELDELSDRLSLLQSKLKRICKAKPKPKGC